MKMFDTWLVLLKDRISGGSRVNDSLVSVVIPRMARVEGDDAAVEKLAPAARQHRRLPSRVRLLGAGVACGRDAIAGHPGAGRLFGGRSDVGSRQRFGRSPRHRRRLLASHGGQSSLGCHRLSGQSTQIRVRQLQAVHTCPGIDIRRVFSTFNGTVSWVVLWT